MGNDLSHAEISSWARREVRTDDAKGNFQEACRGIVDKHDYALGKKVFVDALREALGIKPKKHGFFSRVFSKLTGIFSRPAPAMTTPGLFTACSLDREMQAIWDIVHDTKPEDILPLSGESPEEAVRRTIGERVEEWKITNGDAFTGKSSELIDLSKDVGKIIEENNKIDDPVLDMTKQSRLKALLAKPELTDSERDLLRDLMAGQNIIILKE